MSTAYIEKDAALERRFQPIFVDEPSVTDTIAILRGLKAASRITASASATRTRRAAMLSHRHRRRFPPTRRSTSSTRRPA
jgi:ATP-dependent Clp protease ATP-binding subunit ClpB